MVEEREAGQEKGHRPLLEGRTMSVLWEKLVGDTEEFGFRISFQQDPDHGRGATNEESLSWGSFQLWVEGQNLAPIGKRASTSIRFTGTCCL